MNQQPYYFKLACYNDDFIFLQISPSLFQIMKRHTSGFEIHGIDQL